MDGLHCLAIPASIQMKNITMTVDSETSQQHIQYQNIKQLDEASCRKIRSPFFLHPQNNHHQQPPSQKYIAFVYTEASIGNYLGVQLQEQVRAIIGHPARYLCNLLVQVKVDA